MLACQRIRSTTATPEKYRDYTPINVLKWRNNKWKGLCPYYLRTDGAEENHNPGNVLFENFYQGSKVYDRVYYTEVYPSRHWYGNPKYLWWKFVPENKNGDTIMCDGEMDHRLYLRWRNDLWNCDNPIRYPNKYGNKGKVCFSISIDKYGNETRMGYLTARKEIYMNEYNRLVRNLPEYHELLEKLRHGENLMICEIDVPGKNRRGSYNSENNITELSFDLLNTLLNDRSEPFGHGLCLAYALLFDTQ